MYKKIPTARRAPGGCALLIVFFLVCLVLSLVGCQQDVQRESLPQESRKSYAEINYYVDPATSCEYLVARGYGPTYSITPRMNRDGKQVCE